MSATRLLIYSHDSFGLGHLRRCRRIAHFLVSRRKPLSVLMSEKIAYLRAWASSRTVPAD